jgi:hypothetical protein
MVAECAPLNRINSGQGRLILLSGDSIRRRDHVSPQEPIKNPLNRIQTALGWLSAIIADRIPILHMKLQLGNVSGEISLIYILS